MWTSTYIKQFLRQDAIYRKPSFYNSYRKRKGLRNQMLVFRIDFKISFYRVRNVDEYILQLSDCLYNLSSGTKIKVDYTYDHVFSDSGKVTKKPLINLSVSIEDDEAFVFLDFFFFVIKRALTKKYLPLKVRHTYDNIIKFSFSNIYELNLDDYFFLDLYNWKGKINFDLIISGMPDSDRTRIYFMKFLERVFHIEAKM